MRWQPIGITQPAYCLGVHWNIPLGLFDLSCAMRACWFARCHNDLYLDTLLASAGKTTVAGIYGRVLRDLGLLSKGDVMVKVPADFIGDVLGQSRKKQWPSWKRLVAVCW